MVQFHLHSANFMYISEYYEMIMLCNQGETGVLGGAPGHPRLHGRQLPARHVPVPLPREGLTAVSPPGTRQDQARQWEEQSSGMHSPLAPS